MEKMLLARRTSRTKRNQICPQREFAMAGATMSSGEVGPIFPCIRGARQKYGSNSTYFRGTPSFVAYYRDQISRIYASSTAALVQNLAVFALEKIGKSSRSLSIDILKNSKKRNDSRHGTNRFSQGPPNTTHIWARDQFSVQTRAQILGSTACKNGVGVDNCWTLAARL